MLYKQTPIEYSANAVPQLIVVIDTEEEFDWSAKPSPAANTINSIEEIDKVQDIFNEYDIQPCYVVDYPIASQAKSVEILKGFLDAGQCEIGAHLHPWVNPPIEEEMTRSNMYPGNLSYDLEYSKLSNLTKKIQEAFGVKPDCYKAGRYGVGINTPNILHELGYSIDLSICSAFDYSADGGPNFSDYEGRPYWFGPGDSLLEIPVSGAFVGFAGKASKYLYNFAGQLEFLKVRGILSRLTMVDRLMLSPESYNAEEHKKLTRYLYSRGVRTFTWNFHNTSIVPGMTIYTQTDQDVENFLGTFKQYFDFFRDELKGEFTTPAKIKKRLKTLK